MPPIFPPVTKQATVHITTLNCNTLVTLTSSSAITATAISSTSGMVSINRLRTISVAATGQDLNFETRLNVMESTIFRWKSTLEKFVSVDNLSGKSVIEYILLITQLILHNLKLISLLMMRVTLAHLLKRNPTGMLWIFGEHQRMYLTSKLICWFQKQKSMMNQIKRTRQRMI